MTQETLKKMYQLLLTEPHAPNVCAQLERIAREALADHAMRETQQLKAMKMALEALEQTLQTLDDENAKPGGAIADTIWHSEHETLFDYLGSEITAIKEVLAEHAMREVQRLGQEIEQEPLEYWNAVEGWVKIDEVREHFDSVGCATIYKTAGEGRVPLCLAQPEQEPKIGCVNHDCDQCKAQPEQEPVAWMWRCNPYCDWPNWEVSLGRPADSGCYGDKRTEGYEDVPLYTTPPQRKPLTDDEVVEVLGNVRESITGNTFLAFARAIEAAHGIKEKL
jgi:hypothetical protein